MSTNTEDYNTRLARVLGQAFGRQTAAPQAATIEEAAEGAQPVTNVEVGARDVGTVLPVPTEGMPLTAMKELYDKYEQIVLAGALVSRFTDYAANTTKSNDAVEVARERMSATEVRLYDWWTRNGIKDEFDWNECGKDEKTPPGKEKKVTKEWEAMQWMYEDETITRQNYYWLRAKKPEHFHVVTAYAKIISAAHDIVNGIHDNDPVLFKEYQSLNKIIGTVDKNINDFMKEIHKLLEPLENTKAILQGRKKWCAKKCGINVAKEGTLAHKEKEMNTGVVVGVTRPSDAPRGAREARTETTTLKELMANRRKREAGGGWTAGPPAKMQRNVEREDLVRDPLDYRPESPRPVLRGSTATDLTREEANKIILALKSKNFGQDIPRLYASKVLSEDEIDQISQPTWVRTPQGVEQLRPHYPHSNKARVLYAVWNSALKDGRVTREDYINFLGGGNQEADMAITALLHDPAALKVVKERWSGDESDTEITDVQPAQQTEGASGSK
uniref:Uncharacterized protein n=1 Tax=Rhizoctonia cerealis orthocurvulavirus TaxID=3068670 RepID=A0AA51BS80_9VIRU|nr:MAG: hypothetical protein [Rhizoctonia cerealis orthocurvulavirus]